MSESTLKRFRRECDEYNMKKRRCKVGEFNERPPDLTLEELEEMYTESFSKLCGCFKEMIRGIKEAKDGQGMGMGDVEKNFEKWEDANAEASEVNGYVYGKLASIAFSQERERENKQKPHYDAETPKQ